MKWQDLKRSNRDITHPCLLKRTEKKAEFQLLPRLLRMRSSLLVAHVLSQGKDEDKGSLQKPKGLRQGEFP